MYVFPTDNEADIDSQGELPLLSVFLLNFEYHRNRIPVLDKTFNRSSH